MVAIDYSTLNLDYLQSLKVYIKPPTYHLQDGIGNMCFMDPPGYPTYFLKNVYNASGNTPANAPDYIIRYEGVNYIVQGPWKNGTYEERQAERQEVFKKLWKPLPLGHYRVQAWIAECHRYFRNCYVDPRKSDDKRRNADQLKMSGWFAASLPSVAEALGIEVSPNLKSALESCRSDLDVKSLPIWIYREYRDLHDEVNARTYRPTTYVQEFYPEYKHGDDDGTIDRGNWWEVFAERPAPEECPGETLTWGKSSTNTKHPVNGGWCQVCGWKKD